MKLEKPYVFIFTGRSGCGKGTQAQLLIKKLKEVDPHRDIVYLETGKLFREFIKGDTYSQQLSKKNYDDGGLQPQFLTISMWSQFFIKHIKPDVHVVMDGTPRIHNEAIVLDSVVKFYHWPKPHVLYLNISRDVAVKRLMERGRMDDNADDINARLNWFDTHVAKALKFFQDNPDYFFHDLDGEVSPEKTHKEILELAGLS